MCCSLPMGSSMGTCCARHMDDGIHGESVYPCADRDGPRRNIKAALSDRDSHNSNFVYHYDGTTRQSKTNRGLFGSEMKGGYDPHHGTPRTLVNARLGRANDGHEEDSGCCSGKSPVQIKEGAHGEFLDTFGFDGVGHWVRLDDHKKKKRPDSHSR